nr:MAG TPA: hypothetical protein [Bacteriophage sp.]
MANTMSRPTYSPVASAAVNAAMYSLSFTLFCLL